MDITRSLARLTRPPGRWGLGLLMLLSLAACGAAGQPAANTDIAPALPATTATAAAAPTQLAPTATQAEPTEEARVAPTRRPAPSSAPAAGQGWQSYRNEQAGYSAAYPPGWQATELSAVPGEFITAFGPSGGAEITVAVRALDLEQQEPIDPPAGRCQPVSVGGIEAMRCFNMISFRTPTAVAGQQRQVVIALQGKQLDQAIYQRFLDSFELIS